MAGFVSRTPRSPVSDREGPLNLDGKRNGKRGPKYHYPLDGPAAPG